jgi:hypothetical protein
MRRSATIAVIAFGVALEARAADPVTLLGEPRHPGTALRFSSQPNASEWTLVIRQQDVKESWPVMLNGRPLGDLHRQEVPTIRVLPVPPGALHAGENILEIGPPSDRDDALAGPIRLERRSLDAAVGEATLELAVSEPGAGPIPARVTIVANGEVLPPVLPVAGERLAVRPGVVYMPAGAARVRLPAGTYTVTAGRGFEYGIDTRRVEIAASETKTLSFRIRREVPTPGLVAADTHVHSFSFSRHGDATDDERAITLAGEGIELPIATEHNQHASYADATARLGLGRRYTAVVGNEVTTAAGHFNVFPLAQQTTPADATLTDWKPLLAAIRATSDDAGVVILNHPRSVHNGFTPFGPTEIDSVTGAPRHGRPFTFDAIELINSGALQSDPMLVYRDWFALLNHGLEIAGVGASDSHDVNGHIVGQGRTYVACHDEDPGRIDVQAATRSFREGRLLVSLGLLVRLVVDGRYTAGDLALRLGPEVRVEATVLGPSWVKADRLELYANGVRVRAEAIDDPGRAGAKANVVWTLPRPAADTYLVAIATGPGITSLPWPIPKPYQPSSPTWRAIVMASTNPIWLDADADGRWSAPSETAARVFQRCGGDDARLIGALSHLDETIAVQAAGLLRATGHDLGATGLRAALADAPSFVQRAFANVEPRLP